jgi:hypothetical protein
MPGFLFSFLNVTQVYTFVERLILLQCNLHRGRIIYLLFVITDSYFCFN